MTVMSGVVWYIYFEPKLQKLIVKILEWYTKSLRLINMGMHCTIIFSNENGLGCMDLKLDP